MGVEPGDRVLDRFAVRARRGESQTIRFFEGQDLVTGERVLLKTVRNYRQRAVAERLAREGRLLARVNHPAVLGLRASGVLADGSPILVLEHVAGRTVEALMARIGPLAWPQVQRIMMEVLGGLAALHGAQLVHRGVRPSAILLSAHRGAVKLIDLSLSYAIAGTDKRLTASDVLVGSPSFMAPERLDGTDATPASDVYEAALTAYVMLTGDLPYDTSSPTAIRQGAASPKPPPLAPPPHPAIPAALAASITRALAPSPRDRPASAAVFANMLDDARQGAREWTSAAGDEAWNALLNAGAPTAQTRTAARVTLRGRGDLPDKHPPGAVLVASRAGGRPFDRGDRGWLGSILGNAGYSVIVDASHWVAVISRTAEGDAVARAEALGRALRLRLGEGVRFAAASVPVSFVLDERGLANGEPLPLVVQELMGNLDAGEA